MKTKSILLTICIMTIIALCCCGNNQSNANQMQILCDTIQTIDDEPIFGIKNFTEKQTETVRFYLLNGSFRFRTRGSERTYQIKKDTINDITTYKFAMSGFEKKDTLVFRTHDDLFFFFTDYHYISSNGDCVLSDTVIINGRQCTKAIIFPDMGIHHESLDVDLMIRFYWDDMK